MHGGYCPMNRQKVVLAAIAPIVLFPCLAYPVVGMPQPTAAAQLTCEPKVRKITPPRVSLSENYGYVGKLYRVSGLVKNWSKDCPAQGVTVLLRINLREYVDAYIDYIPPRSEASYEVFYQAGGPFRRSPRVHLVSINH